jgi:hypothetical protein
MYLGLTKPWQTKPSVAVTPEVAPVADGSADRKPGPGKASKKRAGAGSSRKSGDPEVVSDVASGPTEETGPIITSASDRAQQTIGADFSLPTATLNMDSKSGDEARALSNAEISEGLRRSGMLDCVLQSATGTDLRGTVTVKMLVDGAGKVLKHRVTAPRYLQSHGLPGCIEKKLASTRFAAVGGTTLATAPFELQ